MGVFVAAMTRLLLLHPGSAIDNHERRQARPQQGSVDGAARHESMIERAGATVRMERSTIGGAAQDGALRDELATLPFPVP
jgi:hypothetical protein